MSNGAPPLPAVQTNGLTRMYGSLAALSGLDLTVNKGDLFGFIGSNGAGKTTTLRILATFLAPSSGSATILGRDVVKEADAVRHVIGYMPDFFGVYKDMEVTEYLDFFGACYRIPAAQREKTVSDVLELVGLSEKKGSLIGALSRGMQQRLGLARVLIHDPQLLLLDEPASGLDPRARIEMRELLRALQDMGKTIFFSSHILSEVADICTSIGIIEHGRLVASGSVAAMLSGLRAHRTMAVRLLPGAADLAEAAAWLRGQPGVVAVVGPRTDAPPENGQPGDASPADGHADDHPHGHTLRLDFSGDDVALSALLAGMVGRGLPVVAFSEEQGDLEDVFMHLTRGAQG